VIDRAQAVRIASSAHAGEVAHVEPRFIELVDGEHVRDARVWLVFVARGPRHVEIAVDQTSGDIVRVQRSR
jgi:hypothetical protein